MAAIAPGACRWAAKVEVGPQQYMIVDGKLYMGGSAGAIAYMQTDTDAKIDRANENWQMLGVTN
jgi:hypothetical protein